MWEGSGRGQKAEAGQARENEKLQSETLWKGCWRATLAKEDGDWTSFRRETDSSCASRWRTSLEEEVVLFMCEVVSARE